MHTVIIALLGVAAIVSAGVFLNYYDEAITSFRKDRKWGVFVSPVSLFLPYFYDDGAASTRRKVAAWFVISLILMISLIISLSYRG